MFSFGGPFDRLSLRFYGGDPMAGRSPISRQTLGKTFLISLSVLGIGALIELGVAGWTFADRYRVLTSQTPRIRRTLPSGVPKTPPPEVLDVMAVGDTALADAAPGDAPVPPAATPEPVTTPIVPPAKPVPIPLAKLDQKAPPGTRYQELVEQGKILRSRGDMSNALTKLREAQVLEPGTPQAITELALTFEKMGLMEKAAEQWKRVHELGEVTGAYFQAAEMRLKQSQSMAIKAASTVLEQPGSGVNPQATIGIGDIELENGNDPAALKKFTLKVPLKLRPRAHVDVHDVVIHVLFYDSVGGKSVVQTSANVNSRWASPPPDWTEGDTEVLEVDYSQPRPDPNEITHEDRKYFGYNVRLYYKGVLQDTRAEPTRLAAQFVAPQTLENPPP
ncbi:MAG: hypothetical protein JWL59_3561 [Chthoniobacteraceae bacterium]|nr:hypothetical protein [Chthoniobacteraceae bacterium]